MSDNLFYVYEHWRPDRGECFYVGKGRGRRANVMYSRNTHHTAIQLKLSRLGLCVEVKLVATGLSEREAFALEMERIAFWRADGADLANFTDGGEGSSNPIPETREKMRQAKLGRKLTDEHKAKIGEASKRAMRDPEIQARRVAALKQTLSTPEAKARMSEFHSTRVRSKEHYAKVSAALKGRKLAPEHAEKARRASVGRVHPKDEVLRRTESVKAAFQREDTKRKHREAMRAFCSTPEERARKSAASSVAVECVTTGIVYPSAKLAGEALGVDRSAITKVCKGKLGHSGGYSFRYATAPEGEY